MNTSIRALILDMDGVIWRGDYPIGDLPSIFAELDHRGYRTILVTNNSTLSIQQYLQKLSRFGVVLESWQVVNSGQATADYLHQHYPRGGPVFIVGEIGLLESLGECGFYHADNDVLAVVVGLDRSLNYEKMSQATLLIRAGVPFIGTNPDRTYPEPRGLVPGAGSILALLEAASGVSPTVIGKPAPEMYRFALERLGFSAAEALVVGDRLETDIAGAQALGCRCALVLSGVTTEREAHEWTPKPDWIASDLTSLLDTL